MNNSENDNNDLSHNPGLANRKPSDPTSNNDNLFADPSGLTGITQNAANNYIIPHTGSMIDSGSIEQIRHNEDIADEKDTNYKEPKKISAKYPKQYATVDLSDDSNNKKYVVPISPSVSGETSASGDMPDPDSDDDTLANAQYMGMQAEEDVEHPQEVDIARDIDSAEEYIRSH